MDDALAILPDEDLNHMIENAWRDAARCWREVHAAKGRDLRDILLADAQEADAFWTDLHNEQKRREHNA